MTASLSALRCVAVPVTDQDRTAALFGELGFAVRFDQELQPGFRWLELGPADGGALLALVQAGDDLPAGIDTGIRLATPDATELHGHLQAQGVDVGELLAWPGVPLMFSFVDFDGNRFYVSEP